MTLETRPFDPAEYLDTDEALGAYLTEALDTGDPAFISDSLSVIARARRRFGAAERSSRSQDNVGPVVGEGSDPRLRAVLETVRALGLRLEATVAQPEPAGP